MLTPICRLCFVVWPADQSLPRRTVATTMVTIVIVELFFIAAVPMIMAAVVIMTTIMLSIENELEIPASHNYSGMLVLAKQQDLNHSWALAAHKGWRPLFASAAEAF